MAATAKDGRHSRLKAFLAKTWNNLGLDRPTIMKMLKFSVPPSLALCIYQSKVVSDAYTTVVGYLIAIGAILSSGLAPRAAYIESTVCNILFLSLSAGVSIFACWTVLKARETTAAPGSSSTAYNSSASAVAGVWFFFLTYVISSVKFVRPQFKFACVMSSILVTVSMTYAPHFASMEAVLELMRRLYGALMTGIAITTGISLFFFPTNCRQIVFRDIEAYINQLRALLESERKYMVSMELQNPFKSHEEGADVLAKVRALRATHGKLFADMGPAKKEIAYGKLLPSDLSEIQRILRRVFLPSVGMSCIINIFQRLSKQHNWGTKETDVETASEHNLSLEYQDVMSLLDSHMEKLRDGLVEAFDHVVFQLQLRGWKRVRDRLQAEDKDTKDQTKAGRANFAARLEAAIDCFYESRVDVLRTWCSHHGIALSTNSFESDFMFLTNSRDTLFGTPTQRQLFIVLYIEYLFWQRARSVLSLVKFADSKVKDGTMERKKFILPGRKTVMKWVNTFGRSENEDSMDSNATDRETSDLTRTLWTDTFKSFRRDPEHLPVRNPLQYVGKTLRAICSVFRSHHSQFGFRLACAAMSIEIIGFLRSSQIFYLQQRLFWAAIMVSVSMTRTSGEASFIYFLRLFGTFVGAVACFIIHYVVDGQVAGILVMYFLVVMLFGYVPAKKPKFALAAVIATVTCTVVIGYELQVLKIGTSLATTNLQLYQPLYLLAPYRLAATAVGILVAYVFTVFPFSITEGSELRKDLGVAIYTLANHYSLVQETVAANIRGDQGDLSLRTSPGRKLERARVKLMSKQMLLLQSMRAQANFTRFQFPLDQPFPRERYERMIDIVENLVNFTALIGFSSTGLNTKVGDFRPETREWHDSFRSLQDSVQEISNQVTTLLCLLSSSILYGQPLPPHLHLPPPYLLLQRVQAANRHILDINHVAEKSYSAFAVLQIASRSIIVDLYDLVDEVRELVGQLDFSLPFNSTALSRHTTPLEKQY